MLAYFRLARGYRTLDLCRWLLTAAASASVAALLLRALGLTLSVPGPDAPLRLLWCLPPLAGVGYLAAAWARSVPMQQPDRVAGLVAAGAGAGRLRLLLAVEIALACAVGTVLGLLGFLALRAHLLELLPGGRLDPVLGTRVELPVAATATLLTVVPLLGGLAAAAALRPGELLPPDGADIVQRRPSWIYLAAAVLIPGAGAALEITGANVLVGGLLAITGIGVAVPALLYGTGMALAWGRPNPVRLLAGRGVQAAAWRLGTPLAVLSIVGALGAVVTARLSLERSPLLMLETGLIALCVLGALLTRVGELAGLRRRAYAPLHRMGVPTVLLRRSAALRGSATALVTLAATGGAAALAAALTSQL